MRPALVTEAERRVMDAQTLASAAVDGWGVSWPTIPLETDTLADDGVAFLSAGIITTPGVACLVRQNKYSAGMVISASHNPFHDNGVKLFAGTGMKFPDDVEEHLETEIHQHKGREMAPHGVPVPTDLSLDEEYLAYLRGRAIPGANLKGLKLVLDCANGAASLLGPALFRSLGAEVIAIHNQPNGRNINDGCGSTPRPFRPPRINPGSFPTNRRR